MQLPQPKSLSITTADWLLLVLLSVIWGSAFFFAELAVREIPPLTLALCRVGIAAVFLVAAMRLLGERFPRSRHLWLQFAVMGLMNNVTPFTLLFWAQVHIASGLASILNATTPLFTVLVAHFATADDKLSRSRVAGLLAGFAGVAITIGPNFLQELGTHLLAELACLGAALGYSFGAVYGRRFRGVPPIVIGMGQACMASLWLMPLAALVDAPWTLPAPSWTAISAVIALGTIATAFGYLIYFRVLARAGATNTLLVTFLIPVTAILLGITLLGEHLEPRHFVGMAVIAAGLAAIDGRPARFLRQAVRSRSVTK
jgi:drug/metabolite transporter (DMT)-like permease